MSTMPAEETRGSHRLKLFAWGLLIITLLAAARYFNVQELLRDSLTWVNNLGPAGPVAFIGIYILATVLFIPGSILTLGAGAVFGVVWGSIYVSIASTVGATLAFIIGRYAARDAIAKKIEGNEKFSAIDKAVANEGRKIVLLTRLSPVFPFNLLNYSFGLTRVQLKDYFLASWIGMMPGTVMYVYIGSLAGSIATLGTDTGGRERTSFEWALYVVGLLATIAVTVFVTKIAKKALNESTDIDLES